MKSGTTLFEEEEPYHSIKEQVLEKLDWNRKNRESWEVGVSTYCEHCKARDKDDKGGGRSGLEK